MGDYFKQTLEKCLLGTMDAIIHQRPISPSTEENCAVAAREALEILSDAAAGKKSNFVPKPPKPDENSKAKQARDAYRFFRGHQDYSKYLQKHHAHKE